MKEFEELLQVARTLNSPGGCPWDLKQTIESLRPYVLEEAQEVADAVDKKDIQNLIEELGDLFYVVMFFAMVGEREGKFTLAQVFDGIRQKLIRRHPHVFGDKKGQSLSPEEVIKAWNEIKQQEKVEDISRLD